jgi:hypothetical protein
MPEPYRSGTEIVSFHTVSKGAYGECGLRGGYMELYNMDPEVIDQIYKMSSINLSPNVPGQVIYPYIHFKEGLSQTTFFCRLQLQSCAIHQNQEILRIHYLKRKKMQVTHFYMNA